jgi:hypothetical protein
VVVFALSAASVAIELTGAAFGRVIAIPVNADPWRTWLPLELTKDGGPKVIIVCALFAALIALLGIRLLSRPTARKDPSATPRPKRITASDAEQPRSPMFNRSVRSAPDSAASSNTNS